MLPGRQCYPPNADAKCYQVDNAISTTTTLSNQQQHYTIPTRTALSHRRQHDWADETTTLTLTLSKLRQLYPTNNDSIPPTPMISGKCYLTGSNATKLTTQRRQRYSTNNDTMISQRQLTRQHYPTNNHASPPTKVLPHQRHCYHPSGFTSLDACPSCLGSHFWCASCRGSSGTAKCCMRASFYYYYYYYYYQ